MVRFATLENQNGRLVETKVRLVEQSTLRRCPHVIFDADHYRADGTCKCNDRNERVMKEWGYRWSAKTGRWL